jgi:hypothetical protein
MMKWLENVVRVRDIRNEYKIVRKPEVRPRRRWGDNIRMDLRETGWKAWTGCICLKIETSGGFL